MGVLVWGAVVSHRRLARFVASPRHDWMGVLGGIVWALSRHDVTSLGKEGIIAVTSATVEKRYGLKLPELRPVYDTAQGRLVDGYEIVSACAVGKKGALPLGLVPHRKAPTTPEREAQKRRRRKAKEGELPSKLDLALHLVLTTVAAGVGAPTVVGDRGLRRDVVSSEDCRPGTALDWWRPGRIAVFESGRRSEPFAWEMVGVRASTSPAACGGALTP